jgi:hypothetical protein
MSALPDVCLLIIHQGWIGAADIRHGLEHRVGLVATTKGASILLTMVDIANPIHQLMVQYWKSDSPQQTPPTTTNGSSQVELDLRVYKNNEDAAATYQAIHRTTLILVASSDDGQRAAGAAQELLQLGDKAAAMGQTVTLRITLTAGSDFKIMGLTLCSR